MLINLFLQFKIDLIVWKYDCPRQKQGVNEMFKIDLIVWKFLFNTSYTTVISV